MHHETKDRPRLDPAAFRGLPGQIVRLIEPGTEADPAAILLQLLTGIGCACGRNYFFSVGATRHCANLFSLIVGDSSRARKGSGGDEVTAIMNELYPDLPRESGLSSGEGLVSAVRDADENSEVPGVDDKRLLVTESEFGSLLRRIGRRENTLSPVLRAAWDGGNLRVLTKAEPLRATAPHIALTAHVVAEELRELLTSGDIFNGLGNRFIFCWSGREKLLPFGDDGSVDRVELLGLAREMKTNIATVCAGHQFKLSATARPVWEQIYLRNNSNVPPGIIGALTARGDPQTLRLAMVFALTDGDYEIQPAHVLAADAIVNYSVDTVRHVFGDRSGDPVADKILRALEDAPDGLTRSEISGLLGRNQPADKITAALTSLEAAGKIEVIHDPGSGRTATIFRARSGFARMLGGLN